MKTEREKMLAGELYDALDPELVRMPDRITAAAEQFRQDTSPNLLLLFPSGVQVVAQVSGTLTGCSVPWRY